MVCTVSLTGQISVTGQRPVYDRGQDLCFKMSHVEAKSINIWLRYDPKQYITSCFHTYTQI